MSVWMVLTIAVAGGVGAVLRYLLSRTIAPRAKGRFPWATFAVNVSGALLLGFATGLAMTHILPEEWRVVVGTGLLGGYTTFSTASVEAAQLASQHRTGLAALYCVSMFITSLAAAGAGLWLASST